MGSSFAWQQTMFATDCSLHLCFKCCIINSLGVSEMLQVSCCSFSQFSSCDSFRRLLSFKKIYEEFLDITLHIQLWFRPAFPPHPLGAVGMLPPLSCPPALGIRGVPPIVPPIIRPVVPIVAPTEKPQTTVYVGKISTTVENDFMLSLSFNFVDL